MNYFFAISSYCSNFKPSELWVILLMTVIGIFALVEGMNKVRNGVGGIKKKRIKARFSLFSSGKIYTRGMARLIGGYSVLLGII